MKVGREQIVGLLAAVREYADDPGRWAHHYEAELTACEQALEACRTVLVERDRHHAMDVATLVIDFSPAPIDADEVARQLDRGTPRIQLSEAEAWRNRLIVNPMALLAGQGTQIGERVAAVVQAAADGG
jgi:seryl-tRNA(Sec) selenium transferase